MFRCEAINGRGPNRPTLLHCRRLGVQKTPSSAANVPRAVPTRTEIVLRWLAAVKPVPLHSVYDRLMPALELIHLAALTIIFLRRQYG